MNLIDLALQSYTLSYITKLVASRNLRTAVAFQGEKAISNLNSRCEIITAAKNKTKKFCKIKRLDHSTQQNSQKYYFLFVFCFLCFVKKKKRRKQIKSFKLFPKSTRQRDKGLMWVNGLQAPRRFRIQKAIHSPSISQWPRNSEKPPENMDRGRTLGSSQPREMTSNHSKQFG